MATVEEEVTFPLMNEVRLDVCSPGIRLIVNPSMGGNDG